MPLLNHLLHFVCFRCLKRMVDNWDALKVFFHQENQNLTSKKGSDYSAKKVESIFTFIRSPTNKLYALFLLYVHGVLEEEILQPFQSDEPLIYKLRSKLIKVVKKIMTWFVVAGAFDAQKSQKPIGDVDFNNKANLKSKEDVLIGDAATAFIRWVYVMSVCGGGCGILTAIRILWCFFWIKYFDALCVGLLISVLFATIADLENIFLMEVFIVGIIFCLLSYAYSDKKENHLRDERISEFYDKVILYYQTLCSYLLKNLPLKDDLLLHAEVADLDRRSEISSASLRFFLDQFPCLLQGVQKEKVMRQFAELQAEDLDPSITSLERMDEKWAAVGRIESYKELAAVMGGILTIPHSSAHCERVFSCVRKNRTDQRSCLGDSTLESLLVLKSKPAATVYTSKELDRLKSCYSLQLKENSAE